MYRVINSAGTLENVFFFFKLWAPQNKLSSAPQYQGRGDVCDFKPANKTKTVCRTAYLYR